MSVSIPACVQQLAAEFAEEEANHIAWIQGNLGEAAIPIPQVPGSAAVEDAVIVIGVQVCQP